MSEVRYERHSDEKDYIYFSKNHVTKEEIADVAPHFHNAVELKLIISGKYSVGIGSMVKNLKSGELSFVAPRQIHHSHSDVDAELYTLVFDSRFLYSVFGKGKVLGSFMPKNEQAFRLLKEALDDAYEKWSKTSKEKRIGFIYRVLGIVAQYYEASDEVFDKSENIAINVMQYIQNNYFEELSLETLAQKFGYTKNHFSFLFNKYVGMNLRDYLNRCRIEVAVKMMAENKDLPLCRIAERVGYKSWVTFYRAYTKYGQSK